MLRSRLDRAFVRYTRTGDPAALARVFDGCAAELYRLGWHLLGDRHAAEDLVQQTFVVAIEQRATFASEHSRGGVLGWLCGILTNRALHVRRMMRQRAAKVGPATDVVVDAVAEVAARELSSTVATAVRGLPEPYRQVLLLHLVHELTPQEVAEALARPGATVRTQLARGLAMLRKVLPVGLTGVAMGAVPAPLGLAGVRAAVLQRAGEGAAVVTAGLGGLATFAGVLVMKKVFSVVVCVLAVLWGWTWWGGGELPAPLPIVGREPAAVAQAASLAAESRSGREAELRTQVMVAEVATVATLEVAVQWSDGTPAADVTVRCRPLEAETWLRAGRTDERGIATFSRLSPGRVQTMADRGGVAEVELLAGAPATATLIIPRGFDVRGRVVDPEGQPIAAATVWMSVYRGSDDAEPVARSATDGTFTIRSASEWRVVTATAPGWGCAKVALLHENQTEFVLDVVLRAAPGVLAGSVVDPEGRPVEAARILVGAAVPGGAAGSSGSWAATVRGQDVWPSRYLLTDRGGGFRAEGLPPLAWPVVVWAAGFAPVLERVQVADRGETTCILRLTHGATLRGQVLDAAGRPAAGAELFAAVEWPGEPAVDPVISPVKWMCPRWLWRDTLADHEGRYEFTNLAAGSSYVWAEARGGGYVGSKFELVAGQSGVWNAVLSAPTPAVVTGSLVTTDGSPLVGWQVLFEGDENTYETTAEGAFRSNRRHADPYRVRISVQPRSPQVGPAAELGEFQVTDAPLRLVLPTDKVPTGVLKGRVVTSVGSPCAGAQVTAKHRELRLRGDLPLDDLGNYEFKGLHAGSYDLSVDSDVFGAMAIGTFEVTAGQSTEAGEFRVPMPGTLLVHVVNSTGKRMPEAWVMAQVLGPAPSRSGRLHHGEGLVRGLLLPGRWLLATWPQFTLAAMEVDIRSGETTELRFVVPDGVPFLLRVPAAARERGELRQLWRDANGRLLRDCRVDSDAKGKDVRLSAPSGRYTLEVRDQEGRAASTTFDLRPSIEPQIVELPLPAR